MIYRKHLTIIAVALLALALTACGVPGQFPNQEVASRSLKIEDIQVPVPAENPVDLNITFGPGKLKLRGGAEDGFVDGTARYNRASLKPGVEVREGQVTLNSGGFEIASISELTGYLVNEWSVRLGSVPMKLKIKAAAFEGDIDLGGVPIQALDYNGKASDVQWDFSTSNPIQMETFYFDTTASDVELSGLANANFERMVFTSDLGDFTLDFSGQLQRDAAVEVVSGTSDVDIMVPSGMRARVTVTGGLTDVDASEGWEGSGSEFVMDGNGPLLEIRVNMTLGSLNLHSK